MVARRLLSPDLLSYSLAAALALCVASASNAAQLSPTAPVVRVSGGTLRGAAAGGVVRYRAIPYAAPPIGALRWAAPRPASRWVGVRDATQSAQPCAQGKSANEDCLYLDITAPADARPSAKKPVMVWLHDGGLSAGSGSTYDPNRLVTQGDVVVVTVDFRLNIFGFLAIDGLPASGDFGLQDQQAALRWIRANIAKFGGDPANITLFGQSGGAIAVCAQLTAPGARGLFQKAIMQSGGCGTSWPRNGVAYGSAPGAYFQPLAQIAAKGATAAQALGCGAGGPAQVLACLRALPADKVIGQGGGFFSAAYGGEVLPIDPTKALESGRSARIPVLTGFTRDESRAIASGMELTGHPITAQNYEALLSEGFEARVGEVGAQYPLAGFSQPALAWSAIYTDRMFACPQLRDAAALARRAPVFAYEFADPHGVGLVPFLPDLPPGAPHTSELPLLLDMTDGPLDITTGNLIPLRDEKKPLSAAMIRYWTQFARTGDPNMPGLPNWPRFNPAAGTVLALSPGDSGIALTDASAAHHCAFWQGFR
ncbi:MAG: Carboxylesterase, type [Caulobacteraceae bacterium]|nr:Carboxylesterase, type [Caulobacteraceae bacterium]